MFQHDQTAIRLKLLNAHHDEDGGSYSVVETLKNGTAVRIRGAGKVFD